MNPQDLIDQAARRLPKKARRARTSDARPRPGDIGSLRAVLKLEIIGDDWFDYRSRLRRGLVSQQPQLERMYLSRLGWDAKRPWVARLLGIGADGWFMREFLRGQRDYSEANSTGSRGVHEYYALTTGVYEVFERRSWIKTRRYFIRVRDARTREIDQEEAVRCLQNGH